MISCERITRDIGSLGLLQAAYLQLQEDLTMNSTKYGITDANTKNFYVKEYFNQIVNVIPAKIQSTLRTEENNNNNHDNSGSRLNNKGNDSNVDVESCLSRQNGEQMVASLLLYFFDINHYSWYDCINLFEKWTKLYKLGHWTYDNELDQWLIDFHGLPILDALFRLRYVFIKEREIILDMVKNQKQNVIIITGRGTHRIGNRKNSQKNLRLKHWLMYELTQWCQYDGRSDRPLIVESNDQSDNLIDDGRMVILRESVVQFYDTFDKVQNNSKKKDAVTLLEKRRFNQVTDTYPRYYFCKHLT